MSIEKPIIFIVGAALGSVGTYFFVQKKIKKEYEDLYNTEIESVRSEYKKATDNAVKTAENRHYIQVEIKDSSDINAELASKETNPELAEQVEEDETAKEVEENVVENKSNAKPYQITETDFYSFDGYDQEVLTLYSDGILAEEATDNILDAKDTVGNLLSNLRANPEQPIFVRNEWLGFDYQIFADSRTYYEVTGIYPSSKE